MENLTIEDYRAISTRSGLSWDQNSFKDIKAMWMKARTQLERFYLNSHERICLSRTPYGHDGGQLIERRWP